MSNKKLWILFTILFHLLSWVTVLGYSFMKYQVFVKENKLSMIILFAVLISVLALNFSLKDAAINGFGMFKRVARSIRVIIPLSLLFIFLIAVKANIGDFYEVLLLAVASNILAQPFAILAYKFSPAYIEDTSGTRLLNK
jgi:ABC-type maltose transport system permease subunit